MEITREHYIWPAGPQAEWWLPPPCARPTQNARHRRRFSKLVNYMISKRLEDEAGVQYEIVRTIIQLNLSCNAKSQCLYRVFFKLENFPTPLDAKRIVNDLKMFAPRGVQRVSDCSRLKELYDAHVDDAGPRLLEVKYVTNCEHNVRFKGNSQIRGGQVPKVRTDNLAVQLQNLDGHNARQLCPNIYVLPNLPEAEWWLPPPCQYPSRGRQRKKHFQDIVKHMIEMRLREGRVVYGLQKLSIHNTPSCKTVAKCFYSVEFQMTPDHPLKSDAKRAINDLRMFAPRGVQAIDCEAEYRDMDLGGTEESEASELPLFLKAEYTVYCKHNVKLMGNGRVRDERVPKVR